MNKPLIVLLLITLSSCTLLQPDTIEITKELKKGCKEQMDTGTIETDTVRVEINCQNRKD